MRIRDGERKLYVLNTSHLNKTWSCALRNKEINFYNLEFKHVKRTYQNAYKAFEKRGYSLVITDNDKSLILKYNG